MNQLYIALGKLDDDLKKAGFPSGVECVEETHFPTENRYRIRIRIEPKTKAVVAPPTSGAPPYCDQCGQLTVIRNGIFKCLSCGDEMKSK